MGKMSWLIIAVIFILASQSFALTSRGILTFGESINRTIVIRFIGEVNTRNVSRLIDGIDQILLNDRISDKEIILLVSSTGGEVHAGVAAYNYLRALPTSVVVKTHNLALVESSAISLYCAGREKTASPISQFIIHKSSSNVSGAMAHEKLRELSERAINYDMMLEQIVNSCTKYSNSDVAKRLHDGAVINSREAKEWGLSDKIEDFVPRGGPFISVSD